MADRVERLTNLLALLLETREPLSLVEIAAELADQYPEGQNARRASFERDKAALREIGVPIEQEIVAGGPYAGQTRYWIDRKRYELRDLSLEPDEARALQVAMAATRPGSASGQEALWKVGAGIPDQLPRVTAILPDAPALPALREAVASRTRPVPSATSWATARTPRHPRPGWSGVPRHPSGLPAPLCYLSGPCLMGTPTMLPHSVHEPS